MADSIASTVACVDCGTQVLSPSSPSLMTTSYAAPTLQQVKLTSMAVDGMTIPTEGGAKMHVVGSGFGSDPSRVLIRYARDSTGLPFRAQDCRVVQPDTELECFMTAGYGTKLVVAVEVDGRRSSAPTVSYSPPTLSSIACLPEELGCDIHSLLTEGGQGVRLEGTGFGASNDAIDASRAPWKSGRWPFFNAGKLVSIRSLFVEI